MLAKNSSINIFNCFYAKISLEFFFLHKKIFNGSKLKTVKFVMKNHSE